MYVNNQYHKNNGVKAIVFDFIYDEQSVSKVKIMYLS
jgi:hypothetical protein